MIFSFILIFFLPFITFGKDFALFFLKDSYYLAIIFILILAAINYFYKANKRFFLCLENSNWEELKIILEEKMLNKKRFWNIYIKLYVNICIAVSKIADIKMIEKGLREHKYNKLKNYVIQFGLPYILDGDPIKMKAYFGEFLSVKTDNSAWIRWNYCFSLLLLKERDEAINILLPISRDRKDKLLQLLALYLLSPFSERAEVRECIHDESLNLKNYFTSTKLEKVIEGYKENIEVLFIRQIIDDAHNWLEKSV